MDSIRVFGIDFTSAPGRRKQIICVTGRLRQRTLEVEACLPLASLAEFETFLTAAGPWIGGFDFPFGQPRTLIENLAWPANWAEYVCIVDSLGQPEFEAIIKAYRQKRPPGDKHHLRATDKLAKSVSPMMLHGVPVGKMFLQGAPRLLRSGVNVLPCRPNDDSRIALEAYPALVARKWLGKRSYKSDDKQKQTPEKELARQELVRRLQTDQLKRYYGLKLAMSDAMANQFVRDAKADSLDALLCAVQAAWALTQQATGYGIPPDSDSLEGWIVDPDLLPAG